ncbi:hypothetical protein GCM10023205_83780 [Yinghuangia aomiensis]|uniref:Protein kinase domain-containing protein n=1 Tax=Yinghuangia aomiensis TaxID=676205 RepID=A0ABP9IGQ9_9ACTN
MKALGHDDPRRVGPFELVGLLGAGGMGRVYLGRSPRGRAVAVKVLRTDLLTGGDSDVRRRFAREVAAGRAVDSRFTAPVVDADIEAAVPWLATAYVPGLPLADAVARFGALPEPTLICLAAGLAAGIADVHRAGLVHRDLKPSNVLLAVDGPRIIDFGIVRSHGASRLTGTDHTVGTYAFMSPEQFERADVGPESDVFSLGAVLAYAATGHAPFSGDQLPVLWRSITHHEPDLAGTPAALLAIVTRCLAKDPAARPDTAWLRSTLSDLATNAGCRSGQDWLPSPLAHALLEIADRALAADGPGSAADDTTRTARPSKARRAARPVAAEPPTPASPKTPVPGAR